MTLNPETTVGELVVEQPNRSRLFEELRIDYCCGGRKPLRQVCEEKGLALEDVLARLEQLPTESQQSSHSTVAELTLGALIDHIVDEHHAYLRRELPRLDGMIRKVARVHGEKDHRLVTLPVVFAALIAELGDHLAKEERILFPAIRRLESGDPEDTCFASVGQPIQVMLAEHDSAGHTVEEMRRLTEGFNPPTWACNTYRAMLDGLRELEADLHQHIHEENNILFPRALEREQTV
ncbi:MAG: iron-sulfur cluster repair di-iron protein [Verrucomicrobiae bacterium]|nr:iron-sulfur cluster repair di-iron protein [Verrucomicrobiae bacterium]MCP5524734.1 iron-sulfur cluster repair di-iron protein [Verrucomicrobiales bacterium]